MKPVRRHAMRIVVAAIGVMFAGHAAAQQPTPPVAAQQPAPQAPAPPAPPSQAGQPQPGQTPLDLNAIGRDRIAAPQVISEAPARYTAEAMRNRLQGKVRVRAIVEPDGTVSNVEVIESLDKQYGLDEQAVDSVKQWRFKPGTLDGNPIRVMVNIDVTFVIRDDAPVQGWPQGFANAAAVNGVEETMEAEGLRLKITRPTDWVFRQAGLAAEWGSLRSADGLRVINVVKPQAAPFELRAPAGNADIARVAEAVTRLQAPGSAEIVAVGQVQPLSGGFWVWSALRLVKMPNPPGTTNETNPYGEGRAWAFAQTINGKIFLVQCTLLLPKNLDAAAMSGAVQGAVTEFASIVNSVRVEPVN